MNRIEKLPACFDRYKYIGGILRFGIFETADAGEDHIVRAIASTLATDDPYAYFHTDSLRALGSRTIEKQTLLGEWHDPSTGLLRKIGNWTMTDGRELVDPTFADIGDAPVKSGSYPVMSPGGGGELAFAFSHPPYGLRAKPNEVQQLFDHIMDFILPDHITVEIRDWSSPQLPQVSDYFEAGMEWWGVFLFSIYLPSSRQLTVIAGSTSD